MCGKNWAHSIRRMVSSTNRPEFLFGDCCVEILDSDQPFPDEHDLSGIGSGSSAACVGRHVTAVLSVSKHTQSKDEILRVENAQADRRNEAAICRQCGARLLLILPNLADL